VDRLGRSSVGCRVGIFKMDGTLAAAQGFFAYVYVERARQRPAPSPDATRPRRIALTRR
jgi:acyl-CoA thioesterase FadM